MTDTDLPEIFDPVSLVREFHEAFQVPNKLAIRRVLIGEEVREFIEAIEIYQKDKTVKHLADILKEACDVAYVLAGTYIVLEALGMDQFPMTPEEQGVIEHIADVTKDIFGTEVMTEGFLRVHESNMSKLGEDGKPVIRGDGKVLKGPSYKEPDLTDLVTEIHERISKEAPVAQDA